MIESHRVGSLAPPELSLVLESNQRGSKVSGCLEALSLRVVEFGNWSAPLWPFATIFGFRVTLARF